MPKFDIEVCRIGYAYGKIPVEADTLEEANDKALDEAGNYCYSEKSSEYKLPEDFDESGNASRLLKKLYFVINKDKGDEFFICKENLPLLNEIAEELGLKI